MNFYISFILFNVVMCVSESIVSRSGLEAVVPAAVGLRFYAEVNNTGAEPYVVQLHPDQCCLDSDDQRCDVLELMGSASETVPSGSTSRLYLVAPLLDPYERKGFCSMYVDYRPKARRKFIRSTVKIKFDTSLRKSTAPEDARVCPHLDEDPLNNCKPVYCDTFYNGKKSYFNVLKKRCVEVPTCLTNAQSEIPKSAYNPVSNKCINKPAINNADINFIKSMTVGKLRPTKNILIINLVTKNSSVSPQASVKYYVSSTVSTVSGELKTSSLAPATTGRSVASLWQHNCFIKYIACNKRILLVLSGVILVQCCFICTMMYCFMRSCTCFRKKKIVDKFFNYGQDATVTTPLICTSNVDTDTTDYHYLSESSNYIDKKIRCYKACQKERKTTAKISMSDDILSKCVTRRDWRRLPRSETIPEVRQDDLTSAHDASLEQRKLTDTKVNFQDEKNDKKPKFVRSIVEKLENKSNAGTLSDSSEKVIRCHSYKYEEESSAACKQSGHNKVFGVNAGSIEQGAQACFSNDSIDDFLSERGVLFIGDNASKYSFSSLSSANSSRSSKTSKNNVIRNIIPFLTSKVKGPSSEPGLKKSKADLDLELLHISRVSVCSSSNDSDPCKDLTRIKDSTSSL